ncbi:MAG: NAD-dependent epimerase/dehydratase family protein [Vicinamibacteria bacterium]|nr:NAD-dependent epimerase/dehydratase family protein [Vicinamibacteria bacterium]
MRYLITGGAGFIGSNAAARCAREGHEVLVLDNLSRFGSDVNAAWLSADHGVVVDRTNLCDASAVRGAVRDFAPDAVIHCAGQVAVTTSILDPRRDFEENALGTFNVLEALRIEAPGAILVHASTNKVYGGMEDERIELRDGRWAYASLPHGCSEERNLDFHSPYGCSKGAADQYVRDYARIYGLRTVVLRQSCIYGYRQFGIEDQGWVAWFTIQSVRDAPVTIFGDGRQVRDVLFIDDLLDAYFAAVARIAAVRGRVYNIGGGPASIISIRELVDKIETLNGRRLDVTHADWRPGDQRVFIADIRKAGRELEWRPRVSIDEGLRRLHMWIQENRELFRN